jgi:predicted PurR-regulated permease PerM
MNLVNEIIHTAGKFLKAQLILIVMIMAICITGFWLIGISSPVLLGFLAGIMDALPFIGTSIILIPTAVILFLDHQIWQGAVCLVIYLLCVAIREFMEPKLMGKELDIFPVVMLISIFAGAKLFGISGIIKGPLAVVLYKNIRGMLNKVDKPEKKNL